MTGKFARVAVLGETLAVIAEQAFPGAAIERFTAATATEFETSARMADLVLIETDGLPIEAGLAHEIYHGEGRGPDMEDRIGAFRRNA